ncbi:hypothetical protein DVK85_03895 [Flavobacterium arcticum]|uniref:Uncharacterized protein n=1 Tax=Flavobacterium arcticum TaxID=1784713 RepID=A0A345HA09_9FLAO|nr:hypothetical protein [Flavobacterium arcticum]AXG73419.1 hypothetical protein DVK85_03895 [Flavobacterium arcticum]KAF2513206.1 hypothetical protein E0W72_01945 [Flavobacterium arcticum]
MRKNKKVSNYTLAMVALILLFWSLRDSLIDLSTNVVLVISVSFVALVSFMAYLKFREDKKAGTVDYGRIAIGGVFIALTIGYGIYDYISFPY